LIAPAVLDGVRRHRFEHEGRLVHLGRRHGQAEVAHLVEEADHLSVLSRSDDSVAAMNSAG
jgi:hypothetical protein